MDTNVFCFFLNYIRFSILIGLHDIRKTYRDRRAFTYRDMIRDICCKNEKDYINLSLSRVLCSRNSTVLDFVKIIFLICKYLYKLNMTILFEIVQPYILTSDLN